MTENMFECWYKELDEANQQYSVLTSSRFSRGQPTNPALIRAILRRRWPSLIFLWGGSKESKTGEADKADLYALDNLMDVALRSSLFEMDLGLEGKIKTTRITGPAFYTDIVFCDSHHIHANGIPPDRCETYFKTLKALVDNSQERFKKQYWEKELFKNERISLGDHYNPKVRIIRLSNILEEFDDLDSEENPRYFEAMTKAESLFENQELMQRLARKSELHSSFKVSYNPQDIAKFYAEFEIYFLRLLRGYSTKRFGGFDFRNGFFASFSDPRIQRPIAEAADVPLVYLKSNCPQSGSNESPWYFDWPSKE